ncbi:MAG TPA: aldolase/citrate lyase family protein [Nocardia sp.]|nr:aldolase/citrate lyase family protein [Nocardia sp.]HLS79579.1 aldolase/citrate lyase family protein [Nocardia sp.]
MTATRLPENVRARIEAVLEAVDAGLRTRYPGPGERPQPIHTAYVPADQVTADTPAVWGAAALDLLDRHAGELSDLDTGGGFADVRERLRTAPVQDLRIDFEDGYGPRPDDEEDAAALAAGEVVAAWAASAAGPHRFGIRVKGLGGLERRRALRTLELVLDGAGGVPDGFVVTVPKVRAAEQVSALVALCEGLERGSGLAAGALRFELQIESPQAIIGPNGDAPVARMITLAEGRCDALHFGTYDYTADCGVAAPYQALDHPAADHAKAVMQVAAAQTGVWVCDGSTQIVPEADPPAALREHHRLVTRSLRRGYYQGWDMHPGHLITRWAATYEFFRTAAAVAVPRLDAYLGKRGAAGADVVDEPATAQALAATVLRALQCGACTEQWLRAAAPGLDVAVVRALALRRPLPDRAGPNP